MAKQFVLHSCFSCTTEDCNIMTDKGFNLFDEYAAKCVHLFPQKSVPLLTEETVKCTHLAG